MSDEDAKAWKGEKTKSMEEVEPLLAAGDSALGELTASSEPRPGRMVLACGGCGILLIVGLLILTQVFLPKVAEQVDARTSAEVEADMNSIGAALEAYAGANGGRYPETLQELVMPDESGATWFEGALPADPWGGIYTYTLDQDAATWILGSKGVDGIADANDPSLAKSEL